MKQSIDSNSLGTHTYTDTSCLLRAMFSKSGHIVRKLFHKFMNGNDNKLIIHSSPSTLKDGQIDEQRNRFRHLLCTIYYLFLIAY